MQQATGADYKKMGRVACPSSQPLRWSDRRGVEFVDIFRAHGPAWRQANAGHVGLTQLKARSAIQACRIEPFGGHVAGCVKFGYHHIANTSCKNLHCPSAKDRPRVTGSPRAPRICCRSQYFHVVFTLPAEITQIPDWNKKAVYGLLFRTSAMGTGCLMKGEDPDHQRGKASHIEEPWHGGQSPDTGASAAERLSPWADYRQPRHLITA